MPMIRCFMLISLIFLSCSSSIITKSVRPLSLSSISDPEPRSQTPYAYINLQRDSNTVSVWNCDDYDNYNVYRANTPKDSFYLHGQFSSKRDWSTSGFPIFFYDKRNNSIQNRYQIRPVVDGKELNKLPTIYETSDTSYYKLIEMKK